MNPMGVRKADQPETVSKKVKQAQEEPEESGVKLDDLPELPFELILSYLSLEDRIKSRAVSRRWYNVINSFRPKSLCLSEGPSSFAYLKNRWVIGEFAQNFISSTKFKQFFQTFGQSILANLKHLRLCNLDLNAENTPTSFVQIINSFGQLEELDLYNISRSFELDGYFQLRLNLPMLKSVQLVFVQLHEIEKLTLDAPRLQKVKHRHSLKVELVHGKSVEKLIINFWAKMEVSKMKNLKYLYCGEALSQYSRIDPTLFSTLEHLKEIHLNNLRHASDFFQQKERYGRSNLKIFLFGFHLNASDDPAIESIDYYNSAYLRYLAENPSKVSNEIPLYDFLRYPAIEAVAPGQETGLLKRFTDLECIKVVNPVQDVARFLELFKNLNNIVKLHFYRCDQPQELFDRLPDNCAIQHLAIIKTPADLDFLLRLKSLINLELSFRIDIEIVSRVLEELPFLMWFSFYYLNEFFEIRINHLANGSKNFWVLVAMRDEEEETMVSDVNAVVQWICEKTT